MRFGGQPLSFALMPDMLGAAVEGMNGNKQLCPSSIMQVGGTTRSRLRQKA